MDLQLILIPIVTVAKVLLVAVIGGIVGGHVHHPEHSNKGMSVINVKIFLPAMLFSRMAIDMDVDLFRGGYGWAIVFSFVPLGMGFGLASIFKRFLPKELHGLFYLASTFQNALAFGLGLVLSLSGPSWITPAAYAEFTTVIFMYNLPHSLAMWSWGTLIVRHAKEDEMRDTYAAELLAYEAEVARRAALVAGNNGGENNSGQLSLIPLGQKGVVGVTSDADFASVNTLTALICSPVCAESPRNLRDAEEGGDEELLPSLVVVEAATVTASSLSTKTAHGGQDLTATASSAVTPPAKDGQSTAAALVLCSTDVSAACSPTTDCVGDGSASATNATAGTTDKKALRRRRKKFPTPPAANEGEGDAARHQKDLLPPLVAPTEPTLPPQASGWGAVREFLVETFTNITILASLTGMVVGLVRPLKYIATVTPFGRIFVGSAETVGAATIPLTLLQLGTSLTSAQKTVKKRMVKVKQMVPIEDNSEIPSSSSPHKGAVVEREVEVEAPSRGVVLDYMDSLEIPLRFIFLAALVRIVIIPAAFLLIFLGLRSLGDIPILGPIPSSKAFQLSIMIEGCAPTAVNTSNLCSMFNYRATAYSQALFGIYVISVATTAVWLSLYLYILGD